MVGLLRLAVLTRPPPSPTWRLSLARRDGSRDARPPPGRDISQERTWRRADAPAGGDDAPRERPRLNLAPRSAAAPAAAAGASKASVFGAARPREEVLREQGRDAVKEDLKFEHEGVDRWGAGIWHPPLIGVWAGAPGHGGVGGKGAWETCTRLRPANCWVVGVQRAPTSQPGPRNAHAYCLMQLHGAARGATGSPTSPLPPCRPETAEEKALREDITNLQVGPGAARLGGQGRGGGVVLPVVQFFRLCGFTSIVLSTCRRRGVSAAADGEAETVLAQGMLPTAQLAVLSGSSHAPAHPPTSPPAHLNSADPRGGG